MHVREGSASSENAQKEKKKSKRAPMRTVDKHHSIPLILKRLRSLNSAGISQKIYIYST